MPLLRYIYAALVFAALVFLYIGAYLLNKRVKKPQGCEEVVGCANCGVSDCALNPKEDK